MSSNGYWVHKDSRNKQERMRASRRKQDKYAEAQRKKWLKTCTKGELLRELWGKLWK